MTYKDKTFCASEGCKNECGRKLTAEEKKEIIKTLSFVSMSYFCDKNGNLKDENNITSIPIQFLDDKI